MLLLGSYGVKTLTLSKGNFLKLYEVTGCLYVDLRMLSSMNIVGKNVFKDRQGMQ
jgi:hypothetical protein